ncbi:MAG: hypothetical protein E7143_01880 [Rikenellaceae bacterium]|nr:hypothetical protein [Rikenellaceae bacterium]
MKRVLGYLLLALLGFAASSCCPEEQELMYGTPNGEFQEQSGKTGSVDSTDRIAPNGEQE